MAVEREIWVADIKNQLFEGAEWIRRSTNHDAYVNYKKVYIPNSGTLPAVQVNPTVFPLTIGTRADVTVDYLLNQYANEPTLIHDWDAFQVSYDKQASVIFQHVGQLNERIALDVANSWAVSDTADAARIVRTTGSNGTSLAPSATGTRKKLTYGDITKAALVLDRANAPRANRVMILDTAMYYELFEDTNLIQSDVMGRVTLPEGVINRLAGFDIYVYNRPVIYTNATDPVKKAVGAAGASADNLGAIFYQQDMVANALGAVKAYAEIDKPDYLGSVFNTMVIHGSSVLRTDRAGIGAIVQAHGV